MASHTSKRTADDASPLDGVTFDLNGEKFTCYGRVSMFRMAETARRLAATRAAGENIGMAMAAESMHEALGPAEYARFTDYFIENDVDDDVIMAIITDINAQAEANVEAATGRPTVPSSASSSGEPALEGQPARIIKLGTRGSSLLISDGDSPSSLAAQVAAARGETAAPEKPAARKRAGRAAAAG